ncbi:MAG: DMT family transporter [Maioricimonas sp. JB049]
MQTLLLMLLAVAAGFVVPIQSILNGRLGNLLENPLLAALVSFLGGSVTLGTILLMTTPGIPQVATDGKSFPWYLFTGGAFGAVFVTSVLVLVPQIGTTKVLAAAVVGQFIMALIVDHFGILGVPHNNASLMRVAGCLLLITGMLLINRG